MYKLHNISLSNFGFIPIVQQQDSDVALTGFLDMPARLGKTFHDWANEDGVEPYVSASEIFFGGRDLKLTGIIQGTDLYDCNDKLAAMYAAIDAFSDLVPLQTDYETYNVYINAPIVGEYLCDYGLKVTIPMREPVVTMNGILPAGNDSELGIDGISFASLGGVCLELTGDRWNRPAPKQADLTVYGKEGFAITKKSVSVLDLKIFIYQETYSEFKEKITALYALFSAPGLRNLTVYKDKLRSFFVKDGFQTSGIRINPNYCFAVIEVKLTESGVPGTFADLVDSLGNIITDNSNNIIRVRI